MNLPGPSSRDRNGTHGFYPWRINAQNFSRQSQTHFLKLGAYKYWREAEKNLDLWNIDIISQSENEVSLCWFDA